MSFREYHEKVEENDTVILYLGFDNMHAIKIKRHSVFQTKYGALKHNDVIGTKFGSKIQCPKGYLYILYPTPELWTQNLPHRTQILYTTDISLVTLQLDLKPGSVVVESGTGSGSLSHSLIRTILPTGHLYTFEFHKERSEKAAEEFKDHGLSDYVTVTHRDVCQQGFDLENVADAVFLDLPVPWDALASAKKAIKLQGGRLCSFSPCIEQVQKTCEVLRELGFEEITTQENLVRTYDVRTINLPNADLGSTSLDKNNVECVKREKISQKETGKSHPEEAEPCIKQELVEESSCLKESEPSMKQELSGESSHLEEMDLDTDTHVTKELSDKLSQLEQIKMNTPSWDYIGKKTDSTFSFKSAVSLGKMPGHTGYLTFATLYPS